MTSTTKTLAALLLALAAATASTIAGAAPEPKAAPKANPSAALLQCGGYLDRLSMDKAGKERQRYRRLARRFVRAGNAIGNYAGVSATEQERRFELGRSVYDSEVSEDFARKCPIFETLVNQTMQTLKDGDTETPASPL